MPGRSGSANGRESTADENVPGPGPPLVEGPPGHHARREDARPKARQPFVIGTRSGHMPVFVETAGRNIKCHNHLMDILGYPEQDVGNG
jgi:hypothetical protein